MKRAIHAVLMVFLLGGFLHNHNVSDNFEGGSLSKKKWYLRQTVPEAIDFEVKAPREGRRSLIINVNEKIQTCEKSLSVSLVDPPRFDKKGNRCPTAIARSEICQRNEIRVAKKLQRYFGEEHWYRFSFKMSGRIPQCGSTRWVVGQWKHTTADSPFLAQRFDNGVFHISVQDGHCRCRITKAKGDPDIKALIRAGKPLRCINTQEGSPKKNKPCKSSLTVEYATDPSLPDPKSDWVDMTYRVRGGRDGRGLIEIYANKKFVARVKGPIGYMGGIGEKQYFKIGNYRDFVPGKASLRLDSFSRRSD